MSFALEYRRKMQARERESRALRKANEGFVAMPAASAADTRRNRARVFCALLVAGAFLAVFNSGGLVRYSYGLADSQAGRKLVVVSEKWHAFVQAARVPDVVEEIRSSVTMVRHSSWRDIAGMFGGAPQGAKPLEPSAPEIVPAKAPPPPPQTREPEKPGVAKPSAPVMRAAADALPGESR